MVFVNDPEKVLYDLGCAADAVAAALHRDIDWGPSGVRTDQYRSDVIADEVVHSVLRPSGYGILSEESGIVPAKDEWPLVIVDPLDGSTNAWRGIPYYASSFCAVDDDGPFAAVVLNLAADVRYEALRGMGSFKNGEPLSRGESPTLSEAIVGISGLPSRNPGWGQFRCLGAIALDLCAVADGTLDGYLDCSVDAHGVWDYLAASLICQEAGVIVSDTVGRDLNVFDAEARRSPVASPEALLHQELLSAL